MNSNFRILLLLIIVGCTSDAYRIRNRGEQVERQSQESLSGGIPDVNIQQEVVSARKQTIPTNDHAFRVSPSVPAVGHPNVRKKIVIKKIIPIVRHRIHTDHRGTYEIETETGNGIRRIQRGSLKRLANSKHPVAVSSGAISWTSPEGTNFSLSYTADEFGFHPVGSHLPTPPPTPEAILRMLALLPKLEEEHVLRPKNKEIHKGNHERPAAGVIRPQYSRLSAPKKASGYSAKSYPSKYQSTYSYSSSDSHNFHDSYEVPRPYPTDHPHMESEMHEAPNLGSQPHQETPVVVPEPAIPTPTAAQILTTSIPLAPATEIIPEITTIRPSHTIIEAPLVPILVGPPASPVRMVVKTPEFVIESDSNRTSFRIGH